MKFLDTQKSSFSVEITPLIDIVFLLVIFFVVTSKVGDSQFLSLDLPESESFQSIPNQSFNEISIISDGSVYINDQLININNTQELQDAISATSFDNPTCPVYQNVTASAVSNPTDIQQNLIAQLTAPVKWTQTMKNMVHNNELEVIEVGPGKVLQGLFKKVDRAIPTSSASFEV